MVSWREFVGNQYVKHVSELSYSVSQSVFGTYMILLVVYVVVNVYKRGTTCLLLGEGSKHNFIKT